MWVEEKKLSEVKIKRYSKEELDEEHREQEAYELIRDVQGKIKKAKEDHNFDEIVKRKKELLELCRTHPDAEKLLQGYPDLLAQLKAVAKPQSEVVEIESPVELKPSIKGEAQS